MLGYDAAQIHAMLNHLPAALLPVSVLLDLLGAFFKRESLRAAGFWALIVGVLGTGAAIVSGLLAEDVTPHGAEAHGLMETHETLAFLVLGLFALLALWRLVRRGAWNEKEQPIALTAGVIGVALVVVTGAFGGKLLFEHGVGIRTPALQAALQERTSAEADEHMHAHGATPSVAAPSAARDSGAAASPATVQPDSAKR